MLTTRRPRTCARRQSPRLRGTGIKHAPRVCKRRHAPAMLALLRACSPGKLPKGPRAKAVRACVEWVKGQNFNLKALRAAASRGQRDGVYTQAYFDHLDLIVAKLEARASAQVQARAPAAAPAQAQAPAPAPAPAQAQAPAPAPVEAQARAAAPAQAQAPAPAPAPAQAQAPAPAPVEAQARAPAPAQAPAPVEAAGADDDMIIEINRAPDGGVVAEVMVRAGPAPAPGACRKPKRKAKTVTAGEIARNYGLQEHTVNGQTVFVNPKAVYKCDIDIEGTRRPAFVIRRTAVVSKARPFNKHAAIGATFCTCGGEFRRSPTDNHEASCVYADPDYPAALAAYERFGAPSGPWVDVVLGPAPTGAYFYSPREASAAFGGADAAISFVYRPGTKSIEHDVVTMVCGEEEESRIFRNKAAAHKWSQRSQVGVARAQEGSETESDGESA